MARASTCALTAALVAALGAGAGAVLLPDDPDRPVRRAATRPAPPRAAPPPPASATPASASVTAATAATAAAGHEAAGVEVALPEEEPEDELFGPSRHMSCGGGSRPSGSLEWLARHQGPDGGWSSAGFSARCAGRRCSGGAATVGDAAATGLTLLAFLAAGHAPDSRSSYVDPVSGERVRRGQVVRRGLDWLLARQAQDGRLDDDPQGHAIAALALLEAFDLTVDPEYHAPAQRAVDHLLSRRSPGGGWRSSRAGPDDPYATGWAVLALSSADTLVQVPEGTIGLARDWVERATDPVGTLLGDPPPVRGAPGRRRPTTAALGLLLRHLSGSGSWDPALAPAARLLVADLPRAEEADAYHWFFSTQALFEHRDEGGAEDWTRWSRALRDALGPRQRRAGAGCAEGSWDPEDDRWGLAGGRVCVTALSDLALERCYRAQRASGK